MTSLVYQHAAVNFIFPTVSTGYVQDTIFIWVNSKKANGYDKEIPQSKIKDQPRVFRGRTTEHGLSQDIRQTDRAKQSALCFPVKMMV